ncbi:MAG: beta-lactamase family protein [Acidimicrobiales bacterium]|nr:beta-lactamase family protein [Acidimicrobiales bacterium]
MRRRVLIALLFLFGSACSSGTWAEAPTLEDEAGEIGIDQELGSAIDDFVGSRDGGVVVLLDRDGSRYLFAVGTANAAGDLLETDQPFRVGSIAKTFVATIVLQMVDEGSVDLDQPLGSYLPESPVGADVTVRQLLGHDSGIANYTEQSAFGSRLMAQPEEAVRPEETIRFVADRDLGTPGQFSYSNTNYILLGQLIEAVDGTDLNSALAERITELLGLDNTYFATADRPGNDDLALGWSDGFIQGDAATSYVAMETAAWAAGSLVSTAEDLADFLDALFDEKLISIDRIGEMTFTGTDGYGLGLFTAALGPAGAGYAHNGSIPGYHSTMGVVPRTGDKLVILTNNDRLVADVLAAELVAIW